MKYYTIRPHGAIMYTIIPNYDIHILNEHRQIIEQIEHQPISKLFNISHIGEDIIAVKDKTQYNCFINPYHNLRLSYHDNCWIGTTTYIDANLCIHDNALCIGRSDTSKWTQCTGQNITIKGNALIYRSTITNKSNNSQIIILDNTCLINSKIIIDDNIKTDLIISGYTTIINTIIIIEQRDNETVPELIHIMNSTIGARDNDNFNIFNDTTELLHLRICNKSRSGRKTLNIYTSIPYGSNIPNSLEDNIKIDDAIL